MTTKHMKSFIILWKTLLIQSSKKETKTWKKNKREKLKKQKKKKPKRMLMIKQSYWLTKNLSSHKEKKRKKLRFKSLQSRLLPNPKRKHMMIHRVVLLQKIPIKPSLFRTPLVSFTTKDKKKILLLFGKSTDSASLT